MQYVFPPPVQVSVAIAGTDKRFPVNRVFCVGRNYAAHAREMGFDPEREAPFFFCKAPASITAAGAAIPYPPGTRDFHHEIELVIALGKAGFEVETRDAPELIFGYACGLDMTRRDLQKTARSKGHPWSFAKDIEHGAIIAPIVSVRDSGHPSAGRIWLSVNDEIRQDGDLSELIWSVPEIIAYLSSYYHLAAGDLIYTGTPAGVGAVVAGDRLQGGIEGVGTLTLEIRGEL